MEVTFTYAVNGKRQGTDEKLSLLEAIKKAGEVITNYFPACLTNKLVEKPTWIQIVKSDNHDKYVTYGVILNKDEMFEAKMLTYTTNEVLYKSPSLSQVVDFLVKNYYLAVAAAYEEIK